MTKLAPSLPDGHGLDAVRNQLIDTPRTRHTVIGVVSCASETTNWDKGGEQEPKAAFRALEVVHPSDAKVAQSLLTRGQDRRLGSTVLPLDLEEDLSIAYSGRSEDVISDVVGAENLDDDRRMALGESLERPLRSELARALTALREHKDWVTLGRARRVLQLAIYRLEDNDRNLLRNDEGTLIDPRTGNAVDEFDAVGDQLDSLLEAFWAEQEAIAGADTDADGGEQEVLDGLERAVEGADGIEWSDAEAEVAERSTEGEDDPQAAVDESELLPPDRDDDDA